MAFDLPTLVISQLIRSTTGTFGFPFACYLVTQSLEAIEFFGGEEIQAIVGVLSTRLKSRHLFQSIIIRRTNAIISLNLQTAGRYQHKSQYRSLYSLYTTLGNLITTGFQKIFEIRIFGFKSVKTATTQKI